MNNDNATAANATPPQALPIGAKEVAQAIIAREPLFILATPKPTPIGKSKATA